jgi:hypothetical protein
MLVRRVSLSLPWSCRNFVFVIHVSLSLRCRKENYVTTSEATKDRKQTRGHQARPPKSPLCPPETVGVNPHGFARQLFTVLNSLRKFGHLKFCCELDDQICFYFPTAHWSYIIKIISILFSALLSPSGSFFPHCYCHATSPKRIVIAHR